MGQGHGDRPGTSVSAFARAHNVAIPDAREQSAGFGWVEATLSLEKAHAVRLGTNVHGPGYTHSRIFVCLDDMNAIAVFDRFRVSLGSRQL